MLRLPAVLALTALLAACATGGEAPVVDRSIDRDTPGARASGREAADPAPDTHVVVRGDTLYGIAFRHGLDYRRVAMLNGIGEPYTIYPGQRLRLREAAPGPADARRDGDPARSGATLAGAARVEPPPAATARAIRADPVARDGDTELYAVAESGGPRDPGPLALGPLEAVPAASAPPPPSSRQPPRDANGGAAPAPGPLASAVAGAESAPAGRGTVPSPAPAAAPAPAATVAAASPSVIAGPSRRAAGIDWRWPTAGTLITRFAAADPARQGIDIAGSDGQPIVAAAAGEVVYSGNGLIGYGELIIIKHSDEFLSAYGHNRRRLVAEGQRVSAGQVIAEMGRSGGQLYQLHFEIRRSGRPVDPLDFLPPR